METNNENKNKFSLKRVLAIVMILVMLVMIIVLLYAGITQNQKLLIAMLFSIIFVSIVFYISKWFLKITNQK